MKKLAAVHGFKTYATGIATVLVAAIGVSTGKIDADAAIQMISTALLAMAVRHGIANKGK